MAPLSLLVPPRQQPTREDRDPAEGPCTRPADTGARPALPGAARGPRVVWGRVSGPRLYIAQRGGSHGSCVVTCVTHGVRNI